MPFATFWSLNLPWLYGMRSIPELEPSTLHAAMLFAAFWNLPFGMLFAEFWSWNLPFGMLFASCCWLLVVDGCCLLVVVVCCSAAAIVV
jgi:hypothetical protein